MVILYVAENELELLVLLPLPPGITGMHHQTWFIIYKLCIWLTLVSAHSRSTLIIKDCLISGTPYTVPIIPVTCTSKKFYECAVSHMSPPLSPILHTMPPHFKWNATCQPLHLGALRNKPMRKPLKLSKNIKQILLLAQPRCFGCELHTERIIMAYVCIILSEVLGQVVQVHLLWSLWGRREGAYVHAQFIDEEAESQQVNSVTGSRAQAFPGQDSPSPLSEALEEWLLPGSAQLRQAGHGWLICVLHGLQKDRVHQLPQVLPTQMGDNYFSV